MKLDYAPFYFAEWNGQIFHSAEELERYQKKERTEFWQKKNCLERMQYTGLLVVYGVWFFFLVLKAKLLGQ